MSIYCYPPCETNLPPSNTYTYISTHASAIMISFQTTPNFPSNQKEKEKRKWKKQKKILVPTLSLLLKITNPSFWPVSSSSFPNFLWIGLLVRTLYTLFRLQMKTPLFTFFSVFFVCLCLDLLSHLLFRVLGTRLPTRLSLLLNCNIGPQSVKLGASDFC